MQRRLEAAMSKECRDPGRIFADGKLTSAVQWTTMMKTSNKSKNLKRRLPSKPANRGKSSGKSHGPISKRVKSVVEGPNPNMEPLKNPRTSHNPVFVPKPAGDDLEDDFVIEDVVDDAGSIDGDDADTPMKSKQKKQKKGKKPPPEPKVKQPKPSLHPTGEDDDLPAPSRFSAAIKRALGKDATEIEIADYALEDAAFTTWPTTDTKTTLDNLPQAIKSAIDFDKASKGVPKGKPGSPVVLVVCSGGMRSADMVRAVRGMSKLPVAKLFAKHFKLEEQKSFLKNSRPVIAVGTPARLEALVESGALSLDGLQLLVVDATHRDVKQRTIIENTKQEFLALFKSLLPKILASKFKLLWF